jgi:competence protein ComEA
MEVLIMRAGRDAWTGEDRAGAVFALRNAMTGWPRAVSGAGTGWRWWIAQIGGPPGGGTTADASISHCETPGPLYAWRARPRYHRGMIVRGLFLVLTAALASVAVASSETPSFAQPPGTAQEKFPEGPGRTALFKACSDCHGVEAVVGSLRTRQEWSDVIDQMAQNGAQASDQEYDEILEYLVRHFSPIPVNKATAKALEAALDVPAGIAEAVVTYRQEKGDFKSADDLKKVPGLDSSKVDARKERLVF